MLITAGENGFFYPIGPKKLTLGPLSRSKNDENRACVTKYLFHHTLAASTTFFPGSETRMWYFRPGYDEKSYTQHVDKSLPPLLCNTLF